MNENVCSWKDKQSYRQTFVKVCVVLKESIVVAIKYNNQETYCTGTSSGKGGLEYWSADRMRSTGCLGRENYDRWHTGVTKSEHPEACMLLPTSFPVIPDMTCHASSWQCAIGRQDGDYQDLKIYFKKQHRHF